jgi:hypothetical protein
MNKKNPTILKVVVIGDSGYAQSLIPPELGFTPPPRHFSLSSSRRVGKTSLMRQYVSKLYSSQYKVPHLWCQDV